MKKLIGMKTYTNTSLIFLEMRNDCDTQVHFNTEETQRRVMWQALSFFSQVVYLSTEVWNVSSCEVTKEGAFNSHHVL